MRRAAAAPGPKISRYERPRAVRRSQPDVLISILEFRHSANLFGAAKLPKGLDSRECQHLFLPVQKLRSGEH